MPIEIANHVTIYTEAPHGRRYVYMKWTDTGAYELETREMGKQLRSISCIVGRISPIDVAALIHASTEPPNTPKEERIDHNGHTYLCNPMRHERLISGMPNETGNLEKKCWVSKYAENRSGR